MAARARLAAPPVEVPKEWPHHECNWGAVPAHLMWKKDRRIDAETYLSSGFALRVAMEERAAGWMRLKQIADIWTPSRLKATLVSPENGVRFYNTSQVFDIRPTTRKWLSLEHTPDAELRLSKQGTILVLASANVGRATITTKAHEGAIISHHFMRLTVREPGFAGWIYAFLRSPQARAIMSSSQYGGIIRHIEPSHLGEVPVPIVTNEHAKRFQKKTEIILDLRNRSHQRTLEAEAIFEKALGTLKIKDWGEAGFTVKASALFSGRRRLDAARHNPGAARLIQHLAKAGSASVSLRDCGYDIWVPNRYKRIEASDGILYYDSADLLEVNPDVTKRFADVGFGDEHAGRVKPNWLLMPCSGQVYGIIGSVVLAGAALKGRAVSNHVIRIAPKKDSLVREGYLLTALSHPDLGRPLIKALAFGSSVPEIDVEELRDLKVVRLAAAQENAIADLAEESASLRAKADVLEREMGEEAGELITRFLAGNVVDFVVTMPAIDTSTTSRSASALLPEHSVIRLRHALKADGLKEGDTGTIVHVYEGGTGYEVEFIRGRKRPKLVTVEPADIELVETD